MMVLGLVCFPTVNLFLFSKLFIVLFHSFVPYQICPGVEQWLSEQLKSNLDIVIGGCTITSCVRDSSIEMKKFFPQLNFFVHENLCAARKDNYLFRCERCFERYMIDGSSLMNDCSICPRKSLLSPVQFAYEQMKDAGVNVVDHYP